MDTFHTTMDVFKLLEKSNCRKCNEATCLAFAAAVFKGSRSLDECPQLDAETLARCGGAGGKETPLEQEAETALAELQAAVSRLDLVAAADRLGGTYARDRLTLKVFGKDVSLDRQGCFYTDLHVHVWLAVPVLRYVLEGRGRPLTGNWVPLRELDGGRDWYRLFGQRCEKPLKKVADSYTDLFEDMVHLFGGRQVGGHFNADISVVLRPLPKVPLLVCYWKPEDGLASDLQLFFDDTADANLNIEALFTMGAGLTLMFEKIALRHG
ncbi:MAG: DUF3786 domain-containing protein [Desulfosarcinaceae bacterium]|nr:DUF3786 domain-containing protein [Desulfosarcinaceae bacterium]